MKNIITNNKRLAAELVNNFGSRAVVYEWLSTRDGVPFTGFVRNNYWFPPGFRLSNNIIYDGGKKNKKQSFLAKRRRRVTITRGCLISCRHSGVVSVVYSRAAGSRVRPSPNARERKTRPPVVLAFFSTVEIIFI